MSLSKKRSTHSGGWRLLGGGHRYKGSRSRVQAIQPTGVIELLEEFIVCSGGLCQVLEGDLSVFDRSQCLGDGGKVFDLWK